MNCRLINLLDKSLKLGSKILAQTFPLMQDNSIQKTGKHLLLRQLLSRRGIFSVICSGNEPVVIVEEVRE